MWHLTSLSFENYRTFERPESMELRPLTVLIGRNNSGKSAIARLPLILRQGLSPDAEVPLLLELEDHDFGVSFIDLVTNRIPTRDIALGLTASNEDEKLELRVKVGFWEEFNQQAVRELSLEQNGEPLLKIEWNGEGDPRDPGLGYKSASYTYAPGELAFLALQPLHNMDLLPMGSWERQPFSDGLCTPQLISLYDALTPLRYLGPFRDAPKRDDRIPESTIREMGSSGSNAARILAND